MVPRRLRRPVICRAEIPLSWPLGPSSCRECGAPIVWAVTDSGRRLPVDLRPDPQGVLEIFTEHFPGGEPVDVGVHRVRTRPADRPASSPAWLPHWATCSARRTHHLPAELAAQIAAALDRKWGPLFARPKGIRP